jgi:sugar phosphate isomerase/epimerase
MRAGADDRRPDAAPDRPIDGLPDVAPDRPIDGLPDGPFARSPDRPLDGDDRVLCAALVPGARFAERLAAARAGGFTAVSLSVADYRRARTEERLGDGDLRAMLADQGVRVADIDPLLNWLPGLSSGMFGAGEDEVFDVAEALGARSVNLALALPMPFPLALLTSGFAGLCDRAAARGLLVHLEPLPWTAVSSIEVAARIVGDAGRANGGIMLDAWHHFRAETPAAALDRAGALVLAVQLSDAPRAAERNLIYETLHRRRLPGDGDLDLIDFLRRLDRAGCRAPLGVEVFSDELARLPPVEVGARAGERLRRLLAAARPRS